MTYSSAPAVEPIARAILVSDDPLAVDALRESMMQLAVTAEVCSDPAQIHGVLAMKKVEAMVVDLRMGPRSWRVMDEVRSSGSNNSIVLMALAGDPESKRMAIKSGASFIFEPPLSPGSIDPILRAAYGMIVRERRRYFRAEVECPVVIWGPKGVQQFCNSLNVSEGGLSICIEEQLEIGDVLQLHCTLPNPSTVIRSTAIVRWCDSGGRAGLKFVSLLREPDPLGALQSWLSSRLEDSFPASVLAQFQKRE